MLVVACLGHGEDIRHPNHRDSHVVPPALRRAPIPASTLGWLERELHARVRRVRRLQGASSTAVHGVWLVGGRRVVVRRYAWQGFLDSEPRAPAREADLLRFAAGTGIPAPRLLAADLAGHHSGGGVAVVVMSFCPGRVSATPDVARLAELAATVHDVDATTVGHEYFPWYSDVMTPPPVDATVPAVWERALALWHAGPPHFAPRLIHRDFHPGNVLWSHGRVSGLVDWANACSGPLGCDLAHCRTNLIRLAGNVVADDFLAAYRSLTGREYDPYWEIAAVLEHSPSHWTRADIGQAETRLAAALALLR